MRAVNRKRSFKTKSIGFHSCQQVQHYSQRPVNLFLSHARRFVPVRSTFSQFLLLFPGHSIIVVVQTNGVAKGGVEEVWNPTSFAISSIGFYNFSISLPKFLVKTRSPLNTSSAIHHWFSQFPGKRFLFLFCRIRWSSLSSYAREKRDNSNELLRRKSLRPHGVNGSSDTQMFNSPRVERIWQDPRFLPSSVWHASESPPGQLTLPFILKYAREKWERHRSQ